MIWPFKRKHKHVIPAGYAGGVPYGDVKLYATDGMGTGHYEVRVQCETCGKRFALVRFHVAKEDILTANGKI